MMNSRFAVLLVILLNTPAGTASPSPQQKGAPHDEHDGAECRSRDEHGTEETSCDASDAVQLIMTKVEVSTSHPKGTKDLTGNAHVGGQNRIASLASGHTDHTNWREEGSKWWWDWFARPKHESCDIDGSVMPNLDHGWNLEAGNKATRAKVESLFGVTISSDTSLWATNEWAPFDGCRVYLRKFKVVKRTLVNTLMEGITTFFTPQFDMKRSHYIEKVTAMTLYYTVAGYVSPDVRVVHVDGEWALCRMTSSKWNAIRKEGWMEYDYASDIKGLFHVRLASNRVH